MSNIVNLKDFAGLTEVHIGAIIGYLVQYNRAIEKVKDAFAKEYKKDISPETIKRIFVRYQDLYAIKRKEFIEHPENRRFYHLADRLMEWEELYEYAVSMENILEVIKIDRDCQDVEKGKDIPLAKAILHEAAWDVHQHRKIEIDAKKLSSGKEEYREEECELGWDTKAG